MLRRLRAVDLLLYLFPILLWAMGCVVLWSLTFASPDPSIHNLAIKQLAFGLIGIVAMSGITMIDYRALRTSSWIVALITLALLLAVEFIGTTSLGATRWLDFGFFQLQPSEVAKITLVIILAVYFSPHIEHPPLRILLGTLLILALPLGLVLKQPDLGTAMILVVVTLSMVLSLRLSRVHYVVITTVICLFFLVGTLSFKQVKPFNRLMHDYQRDRIVTFLDPEKDPLGKGYNVRQAMIAVGNGGLFGKGLGKEVGQLSQLNFLPKAYTDFIFAALAEALGFVGAVLLLAFFGGLLWRVIITAISAKDTFGSLLAYGYFSVIVVSVLVNIGMNLGMMPVTGIPLPFVSAGGTALIMNFIGIGLLQSVVARHKAIKFD